MFLEAITAGTVGGLLWLDKFQVLQLMISRPVVCSPIVGSVVGDLPAGLASGILFELLWLRRPPIGGYISPDVTFGAIATSAVSAWVIAQKNLDLPSVVFMTFLVLFPVCYLGAKVDGSIRRYTGKIALHVERLLENGQETRVFMGLLSGLATGFLIASVFLVSSILVGMIIMASVLPVLPHSFFQAAGLAYYVVPLVGVADLLVATEQKDNLVLFLVSFLVAMSAGFILNLPR